MHPSAQRTSEQLKEIIEDQKKTDTGAREAQEHVNVEEDLNPDNTYSVLYTVINRINKNLNIGVLIRWSGC
jgi:hypothetical protein